MLKKFVVIGMTVVTSMILSSCRIATDTAKEENHTETGQSSVEESDKGFLELTPSNSSFKDGQLETPYFTWKIENTKKVFDERVSDKTYLIVTYSVKNKTDKEIVPDAILTRLHVSQQSEGKVDELYNANLGAAEIVYPTEDDEGNRLVDDVTYQKNQEKKDELQIEMVSVSKLAPGDTVERFIAFDLIDESSPVSVQLDYSNGEMSETPYLINSK